jgi:hypothetical protein
LQFFASVFTNRVIGHEVPEHYGRVVVPAVPGRPAGSFTTGSAAEKKPLEARLLSLGKPRGGWEAGGQACATPVWDLRGQIQKPEVSDI